MKRLCLVLSILLVCVSMSYAAPTITDNDVDEWAETAQNGRRKGTVVNIAANYVTFLHIDVALTSAAVHDSSIITVFVNSQSDGDDSDEDWTEYETRFGPKALAAPNPEALAGAEAATSTQLEVASTTGYEADGMRWIFLEDNVVANSEMLRLEYHDGTPSLHITNGLTNAHDASDTLFNVAANFVIVIPMGFQRYYIEYDNTYDDDGATIHCRSRRTNVTAL